MAQIQFTPYVSQNISTYQPQIDDYEEVPVVRLRSKPKEEIQLAPLPELSALPETPVVNTSLINGEDSSKEGKGRTARNYLMSRLGLSDYQAAALVGSFMRESGLNINAENKAEKAGKNSSVKPSQYGIGIGQGTHNRHDDFVRGTSTHGNSLQSQLDFAADEIERKYPEYLVALKQSTNPDEASDLTYVMYTGGNYKDVSGDRLAKAVAERDRAYGAKHIELYGKDSNNHSARRRKATIEALMYKAGGILKMQKAGVLESQTNSSNVQMAPKTEPKGYVKQFDLTDKPRTKDDGFDQGYSYVSKIKDVHPETYDYRKYYDQLVSEGRQYELIRPETEFPSEYEIKPKYEPTLADLAKFTAGFETFKPNTYELETSRGEMQTLAGYGSANPRIIELANQGKLTEEIARKELERKLQYEYDQGNKLVPNFKNLPKGVQLALVDTSYNGQGVNGTIKNSPNLMRVINSGTIDPKELASRLIHSKNAGAGLGVRSAARRAMALGEYDGNNEKGDVDKYGRQVDYTQYKGPQDGKSSPYYNKY